MDRIQQALSANRLRAVVRQIQREEAGVRHGVVLIRLATVHHVDGVLHSEGLGATHHSRRTHPLQRQATATPHELQVQLSLLVREVRQHLPEELDRRRVLRVALAVHRVLLQQVHVHVGAAHHDDLQLRGREQA